MNSCDVLVIGAGAAGAFAALSAAQQGASVYLVSKGQLLYGNTRLAAGNVACPGFAENDLQCNFVEDILRAGEHTGKRELIELVAKEGLQSLQKLEEWGFLLKRNEAGNVKLSQGGGHSAARTMSCPYRGSSMAQFLRSKVACHKLIEVMEGHILYRLFIDKGRINGAIFLDQYSGESVIIEAGAVILATGGAGMVYGRHTDNAREATGDGMAAAISVGAKLVDMEFMQWMPFAVTHPVDFTGIGCGEPSSAGPRGLLKNSKGEEILRSFNKMTRAQVAQVIFQEIKRGGGTRNQGVIFDPRANREDPVGEKIYQDKRAIGTYNVVRQAYGLEAYQWTVPYEVGPTAHFTLGGVLVDHTGCTGIEGLYAAGEVTGGFHGADRLSSAALTECFVFGSKAGYHAWKSSRKRDSALRKSDYSALVEEIEELFGQTGRESPEKLVEELGNIMWQGAGGVRERRNLERAKSAIAELAVRSHDLKTPDFKQWNLPVITSIELQFMLVVAEAIVKAALVREESRGSHVRLDFPEVSDHWNGLNIYIHKGGNGMLNTRVKDADII